MDGGRPGVTPPPGDSEAYHVLPVTPSHADFVTAVLAVPLAAAQLPGQTEWAPVPKSFVAVTVKRYETPFVNPMTSLLPTWAVLVVHATLQ
jgi:hypothetical protein